MNTKNYLKNILLSYENNELLINNHKNNIEFEYFRILDNGEKQIFKNKKDIKKCIISIINNNLIEIFIIGNRNNELIQYIDKIYNIYDTNRTFYFNNKSYFNEQITLETIKDILNKFQIYFENYLNISFRIIFTIESLTNEKEICYVIHFDITTKRIKYDRELHRLFHTSKHKNIKYLKPSNKSLQFYTENRIYSGINLAINSYGITNKDFLMKNKYKIYELIIPKDLNNIFLYKDPEFEIKFEGKRKILKKDLKIIKFLPAVYIVTNNKIECIDITKEYFSSKEEYFDVYYDYNKLSLYENEK